MHSIFKSINPEPLPLKNPKFNFTDGTLLPRPPIALGVGVEIGHVGISELGLKVDFRG